MIPVKNLFQLGAACALLMAVSASAAEPLCPVKGKAIKKSISVKHNGGDVYFCCPGCKAAFSKAKNGGKFAAKANVQLIATGQAKQVNCVVRTNKKVNPAQSITASGVKVGFCCPGCKRKASGLAGAAQTSFLFNNKKFNAAYKVGKAKE